MGLLGLPVGTAGLRAVPVAPPVASGVTRHDDRAARAPCGDHPHFVEVRVRKLDDPHAFLAQ